MKVRRGMRPLALLILAWAHAALAADSGGDQDAYIRGYAAAFVQREYGIEPEAVSVQDGVVTIYADLSDREVDKIRDVLSRTDGVRDVVLKEAETRPKGWTWLPGTSPFRPILADPRWPRIGASYLYYDDEELGNVGEVTFGAHLPILRYNPSYGGSWDLGLQAGVFSIFDFDNSSDLVNADYVGAVPLTYAKDNFSGFLRIFHQSSHLGDEYLLRSRVQRVNLSYEAVHLLLSYDLPLGLRVYGGGSYIFRIEPSEIRPWNIQSGVEYVGPPISEGQRVRPVVAVDMQVEEEGHWTTNVAPAIGLQFERRYSRGPNFQILAKYFNGKSPNGQFYERHIQYAGLSTEFHF